MEKQSTSFLPPRVPLFITRKNTNLSNKLQWRALLDPFTFCCCHQSSSAVNRHRLVVLSGITFVPAILKSDVDFVLSKDEAEEVEEEQDGDAPVLSFHSLVFLKDLLTEQQSHPVANSNAEESEVALVFELEVEPVMEQHRNHKDHH